MFYDALILSLEKLKNSKKFNFKDIISVSGCAIHGSVFFNNTLFDISNLNKSIL